MIPPSFEYVSPKSLSEAIDLLASRGEGAKVIAGGQSLIPLLKLRLASPSLLIDINRIPGLDHIEESGGSLRIGALARMAEVEASALIREDYPIIHEASKVIGDPLVRNLGTVGGNVSHGDPNNDMPAVMLALGAEFIATGPAGERTIKAQDFFLDTFTVALNYDEILTELRVPRRQPRSGGCYIKLEQKVADFATAGVAVQVRLAKEGECEEIGVGLSAVGQTAIRAKRAEDWMRGKMPFDSAAVKEFSRFAAEESNPTTDIRGSSAYKRLVVAHLASRAFSKACQRGGGAS